jgi:hypothetical protein
MFLLAVLLLSFFVAFFLISLTPYGHYSLRVYFTPQSSEVHYGNASTLGGAWSEQLLYLNPAPGNNNVPRDTSIVIDAPRPVRVFNISLRPNVTITKENYKIYPGPGPSSVQTIYPSSLLEPNTTYNVSAIVAGTPSWWTFTTSSEPSQLTFDTHPSPNDNWFALAAATLLILGIFLQVRKHPGILSNYNPPL